MMAMCQSELTPEEEKALWEALGKTPEMRLDPEIQAVMDANQEAVSTEARVLIQATVTEMLYKRFIDSMHALDAPQQNNLTIEPQPEKTLSEFQVAVTEIGRSVEYGNAHEREVVQFFREQRSGLDSCKSSLADNPIDKEVARLISVGRKIGLDDVQIAYMPVIAGETRVHDMDGKTEDVIKQLHGCKIHPDLWAEHVVNMIVFSERYLPSKHQGLDDQQSYYTKAFVVNNETLSKHPERPRAIFIMADSKGDHPQDNELLGVLAHELSHIVEPVLSQLREECQEEWDHACQSQRPPTQYALEMEVRARLSQNSDQYLERITAKKEAAQEFAAECFSGWVMNSPQITKEMTNFFDKYCGLKKG